MNTYPTAAAAVLLAAGLLAGCGQNPPEPTPPPPADPAAEAARLAAEILILDTHIDLPYRLHEHPADVTVETADGHFDLVRARRGGLDAAFMSIYVPASLQEEGGARAMADGLIDLVEGIAAQAPESFAIARSPAEVRSLFEQRVFALPLGIENGAAIEDDIAALAHFHGRGVRYVTLTHSEPNLICDSSYSTDRRWGGLSPFGREVVTEMNRLGMMVDISHLTDDAARQALELSRAPVIASHSCARHFTPGFERNIPDELISLVAAGGGVVQIAFAPGFLSEAAQKQSSELWAAMRAFTKETGAAWGSPEFRARVEEFYAASPKVETSVADVADHIEHVIRLVGIDHVGLGSDFDGIGDTPTGLENVAAYPKLLEELLRRGYTEQDLRKICGENLLRVWSEVERVAAGLRTG